MGFIKYHQIKPVITPVLFNPSDQPPTPPPGFTFPAYVKVISDPGSKRRSMGPSSGNRWILTSYYGLINID